MLMKPIGLERVHSNQILMKIKHESGNAASVPNSNLNLKERIQMVHFIKNPLKLIPYHFFKIIFKEAFISSQSR